VSRKRTGTRWVQRRNIPPRSHPREQSSHLVTMLCTYVICLFVFSHPGFSTLLGTPPSGIFLWKTFYNMLEDDWFTNLSVEVRRSSRVHSFITPLNYYFIFMFLIYLNPRRGFEMITSDLYYNPPAFLFSSFTHLHTHVRNPICLITFIYQTRDRVLCWYWYDREITWQVFGLPVLQCRKRFVDD